jgi:hypothetical protein
MSTKYVSDTSAGKSISAWIILKRGKHIATVRAYFGASVLVNVFNHDNNRSLKNKDGTYRDLAFQCGRACGYGYDKLTAALSGLEIDGHKLTDHCQVNRLAKPGALYAKDAKAPRGYSFANWHCRESVKIDGEYEMRDVPPEKQGYTDCYRESGLKYLEAMGYSVIQAI